MFIVSQNREVIAVVGNASFVNMNENYIHACSEDASITLARYPTKKRTMEVFESIIRSLDIGNRVIYLPGE